MSQVLEIRYRITKWAILAATTLVIISCHNPFDTRDAQKPDGIGGEAIKPPTSPENVIYNLKTSFENMSIQDYLDVFSEDFMFNPDPDDSLKYIEDFRSGWDMEKERFYAENFLQKRVTSNITFFTNLYEYKPGDDFFDYRYSIKVTPAVDSTAVGQSAAAFYMVKGHAWLFLRDNGEGKWKIYKWVEIENMQEGSFITWGVLRQTNI